MKTRLLPVLLLTAAFPFAALAQGSGTSTNPGGTSSSDQGSTDQSSGSNSNNASGGGTSGSGATGTNTSGTSTSPGGTSSSDQNTGAGSPGSSSDNQNTSGSGASANDANGSSTSSGSSSSSTASAETSVMIPGAAGMTVADLRGKTVYGVDGSSLGQISEVLAGTDGAANSVVINSGGKNVVVSLSSLQMAPSQATAATGTDMSSNSADTSSAQANTASASDARIVLNMTREQLDQAPAYTGSMAP